MKSEAINELATALAKAQSEMKSAVKDANNPFFKSKYADLTSVWEACREALNKNGLCVVQTTTTLLETKDRDMNWKIEPRLITTLLHSSGQWIQGECPLINQKGDMQGLGSAISYARRYGLASICGVTADDDDAEATVVRKSPGDIKSPPKEIPKGNNFLSGKSSGAQEFDGYIIPLKKFQGKKLSDLQDFEINGYCDWIRREGITKPEYLEFIARAESYLRKQIAEKQIPLAQAAGMDDLPF